MQLSMLDWVIVGTVLVLIIAVGLVVSKKAETDSTAFFLGNRQMPWWLLGTSMVATTFAADTPNLVTGLVRTGGVAANWGWWAFLLTGMITAFIYARLWRRLGTLTDIEFYERRYVGKPAATLRGVRAVYIGVFFNVLVMANVTLALIKYANVLFGLSPTSVVILAGLASLILSVSGGLLGVLITDFILFVMAMGGAIAAAWYAVHLPEAGGLAHMMNAPQLIGKTSFFPDFKDPNSYIPILLIPLLVQWWSAWYPGSEPGGGGYIAQRMLAAKDENHATKAVLLFNLAHYALRPWPWILVALASLLVFPDIEDVRTALPHIDPSLINEDIAYPAMLSFLPHGLLGIVVASILAAYISTMSTMLNLGASYVVGDVYVRFLSPHASEKHKVRMGQLVTALLMVAVALLALRLESATQSFRLLLSVGAGTGLLFFLRWFWGRINAWSEIAAMVFSLIVVWGVEHWADGLADWQKYALSVGLTTLGWLIVTLLTPPTPKEKLQAFRAETRSGTVNIRAGLVAALLASISVYALMFASGSLLYGRTLQALLYGGVCILTALPCAYLYKRTGR